VGVSRIVLGDGVDDAGRSVTRARDLIESGLLQRHGIVEVGVTACLGDHPRVPDATLDRSLVATIEAATQTRLAVHVVTPLVFDAQAMVRWLMRLRDLGFGQPVRIGLAGPANLGALMDYAGRRHVPINPSSLAGHCGHAKHLVGLHTPAAAIRTLATAAMRGELGPVSPHIHAVRGLAAAVRWTAAATRGPIRLDPACGFAVEAP
jgi:methylenetetrahydrofolate reductase (NADPH)